MNDNIKTVEKQCSKCKLVKPATTDYFGRLKDGFQSWCKECKRKNHLKNKDKINKRRREEWARNNPKEVLPEGKKRCSSCKEVKSKSDYGKQSKAKDGLEYSCKECRSENEYRKNEDYYKNKAKTYFKNNKEKISAANKRHKEKNRERYREYDKKYYVENQEVIKNNVKKNHYKRIEEDVGYRLLQRCRTRVYQALKAQNTHKSKRTIELIGCTVPELVKHLESHFTEGMTWDNYGEWHIDHIKPCALFDFTKEEQQKECFHYSNLQPLWAEDNYRKSDKYEQASL